MYHGRQFEIAELALVPWPSATGGNTTGPCLLDDLCKAHYSAYGGEPMGDEVHQHIASHGAQVAACHHHRHTNEQLQWAAERACWIVDRALQPTPEAIAMTFAALNAEVALTEQVSDWFEVPIIWTFTPGDAVTNGRHRTCALKAAQVARVPMARII